MRPSSDHFFGLRSVQRADVFLFFGCFSVGSIDRGQMTRVGTVPCWLDTGQQNGCIHGPALRYPHPPWPLTPPPFCPASPHSPQKRKNDPALSSFRSLNLQR